jgi:hypothetical protein
MSRPLSIPGQFSISAWSSVTRANGSVSSSGAMSSPNLSRSLALSMILSMELSRISRVIGISICSLVASVSFSLALLMKLPTKDSVVFKSRMPVAVGSI